MVHGRVHDYATKAHVGMARGDRPSRRRAAFVLLVLILSGLSGPAGATWKVGDSYEPDTAYDESDGMMWPTPDTDPDASIRRVYFNVVTHTMPIGANPNNGVLKSQVEPPGMQGWIAYLGVWKDCNADGYVGAAASGLFDYRSELLADASICPTTTGPRAHNDGAWVHEFLWIGQTDIAHDTDGDGDNTNERHELARHVLHDEDARVWGDHGAPERPAEKACNVQPTVGTTSSTGALLAYADCWDHHRVAGLVNTLDEDGSLGVRFDDKQTPHESDNSLNQDAPVSLWGNPYAGADNDDHQRGILEDGRRDGGAEERPAFTVYDCSGETRLDTSNPTDGSYYDAANQTLTALQSDCDRNESPAYAGLEPEQGMPRHAKARTETDMIFLFRARTSTVPAPVTDLTGGRSPSDLGVNALRATQGGGTGWTGHTRQLPRAPGMRDDLQPTGAVYSTFYARVGTELAGSANLKLPSPADRAYGGERCPATTSIADGVNCDPHAWWTDTRGHSTMPTQSYTTAINGQSETLVREMGARIGDPYNLRDVDCYDGEVVRGSDVYASPQTLTERPNCQDSSVGLLSEYYDFVPEVDDNGNGLGDEFERQHQLTREQIRAAFDQLLDFDEDGATLLEEFQWDTIPIATPGAENARDWDDDGWLDGDEIDYWNTPASATEAPGFAFRDPDSYNDIDSDQLVNQHDNDSDGDEWLDGHEIGLTYPEFADSDCEPEATACTRSDETHYRATDRIGRPGTGDGIPDGEEYAYWGDRADGDCDNDSIPNILDADSDQDGILDGPEIALGFDPCVDDADHDGLKDGQELAYGTDPRNPDTDADGMPDGWEADHGLDPTDPNDAQQDGIDRDGLINLDEYRHNADPRLADTDHDTLDDRREVHQLGTNPASWDTDGDHMPDGWEVQYGLRPTDASDAYEDPDSDAGDIDGDGFAEYTHTNLREYRHLRPANWDEATMGPWNGTDPRNPDTDGDNKTDGYEIATGDEPKLATPSLDQDADNDGLLLADELDWGTSPSDPDTDADGLCDGGLSTSCYHPCSHQINAPGEVHNYGSNPHQADTDADGLTDADEVCIFDPTASGSTHDYDGDLADSIVDPDSDGDQIGDLAESRPGGSEPHLADTDGDGLDDHEELVMSPLNGHPTLVNNPDTDGDLLLDGEEFALGTWPDVPDTDEDGLTDFEEVQTHGTSPFLADTDFDRMPDAWEIANQLNPFVNDANEDPDHDGVLFGLTNYEEYALGLNGGKSTDPHKADTDGDLLDDYWEVAFGLSPTEPASVTADTDGDGLTDLNEFLLGTDPTHTDTDEDGISDWNEVGTNQAARIATRSFPSDPTLRDSDDDGLTDKREKALWDELGPTAWLEDYDKDSGELLTTLGTSSNLKDHDSDNDGLDDGQEFLVFHTHPGKWDTDGDGVSDREEIMVLFTNPHDPTSNAQHRGLTQGIDSDGDGLSDADEAHYGTDPEDMDTDDDGMPDGTERAAWGPRVAIDFDADAHANNLLDPDSDGDGILDGLEFIASGLPRAAFYITDPGSPDTDHDGLTDGEEASNGLTLPSATAPVYVRGSFGLPLGPVASSPGDPPGRHASSGEPAPDDDDADNDGLLDGREIALGSNPQNGDTDADGLPDALEPIGRSTFTSNTGCDYPLKFDADQDCIPDILDEDDDGDGILDGQEAPDGNPTRGPSSPKDADTDDDGICDQNEDAYGTSRRDADSDDDGLSDGLETRTGRCTTPHRTDWTLKDVPLALGRTTFQPYDGNQPPLDPNGKEDIDTDGATPPLDPDTDGDNMIDGLEDWNANGIVDPGEGDPNLQDGDHDGIPDSVELQVFGKMTYRSFLREVAKRGLNTLELAKKAATYDPLSKLKTNPTNTDTDNDGIPDGADLNPNGLNPPQFNLKLDKIGMSDKIDCDGGWNWGCNYRLDPYFLFEVKTGYSTIKPETVNLPELPIGGRDQLVDASGIPLVLAKSATDVSKISKLTPGTLNIALSDNIKFMPRTPNEDGDAEWDKVTLRVTLGDWDPDYGCRRPEGDTCGRDEDDQIDISPEESDTTPQFEFSFKLNQFGAALKDENYTFSPPHIPNGRNDGHRNMFGHEDDGTLIIHIESMIKADFLANADIIRTPGRRILPPIGQEFGI